MDDLLFNIPIYLRSNKEYENERQKAENKMKESWGSDFALGKKIQIKWPPWEYNDIIGYYKLIINSSRGIHDSINGVTVGKYIAYKKRIFRDPNRRQVKIRLDDPWFHAKLPSYYDTGKNLRNTLLKILDDLYEDVTRHKSKTKKHYIDIEYYKKLIECLNLNKYKKY